MVVRKRDESKAIEPVIASLLLIAIAVAAAVITYSWVMNMVSNQAEQSGTSIRIEQVEFSISGGVKNVTKVTVRNTGSVTAVIETIYIDKKPYEQSSYAIASKSTATLSVTLASADYWALNKAYLIAVVTDNGFKAEATYSTPSE